MKITEGERALVDTAQVADLGIPTLPAVLDPMELGKHLELFSLPPWEWGRVRNVGIQVLKSHRGSRCTVEIALRTANGTHTLIGKVYVSGGWDVYQAMKRIGGGGFFSEGGVSIPQPPALLPELQLLVYGKGEGPLASAVFFSCDERACKLASQR